MRCIRKERHFPKRRAEDPGTDPQDPGNTSEIETGSQSEGTVSKVRTGYAGLYEKCQETSQRYERLYQKYFEEQAGILARELQEGEPCPVCGSCSHPKKRYYPEAHQKEQVERAKAMRDQAEKERTEVLERFQAVKGRLESEQSMIVGFLEKKEKQKRILMKKKQKMLFVSLQKI